MYKKRALVLGGYLSLLALAACGPKVIDDADLVSIDYQYTFADWSVVEQWTKNIKMWSVGEWDWIENILRWAKQDDEFIWKIDGSDLYADEYDSSKLQKYPNIILTEVMWVEDPTIWTEIHINSLWTWIVYAIEKGEDGYDEYVVEFNDPKTYSELSYSIKVTNIEKN